jgi:N6-adenosine-specific RNA methylase IME4
MTRRTAFILPKPKLYRAILIDPPWPERGSGRVQRGAQRHYKLLTVPKIVEVILACPYFKPDPDGCHLWLWTTNNYLMKAGWVIEQLGFRYVTKATWAKEGRAGIGQYHRGKTEDMLAAANSDPAEAELLAAHDEGTEELLLGVAGKYLPNDTKTRKTTLLGNKLIPRPLDARGLPIHSRKPPEQYRHIEATSPGPRLEIFAREQRPGWDAYGMLDGEEMPPVFREAA